MDRFVRATPLRLVIFDCDGVLIDSEAITSQIVAAELSALGWSMEVARAEQLFRGMTLTDMEPVIARKLGRAVDPGWRAQLMDAIVDSMSHQARLVDGALAALDGADAVGLPWRIASNSSHQELAAKFGCTGLTSRVRGRVHSHKDVAHGKPAPDLFLATAAAEGVDPADCLVIEDSIPGVKAARAAGMQCLGYSPHGDVADLAAFEAYPLTSMHDVPRLLALAVQVPV
jgi:HAD superfamily hydrolase (TIGR01509 family)